MDPLNEDPDSVDKVSATPHHVHGAVGGGAGEGVGVVAHGEVEDAAALPRVGERRPLQQPSVRAAQLPDLSKEEQGGGITRVIGEGERGLGEERSLVRAPRHQL